MSLFQFVVIQRLYAILIKGAIFTGNGRRKTNSEPWKNGGKTFAGQIGTAGECMVILSVTKYKLMLASL